MGQRVGECYVQSKTFIFVAMNDSIIKNILVNIRALFSMNLRKRVNDNSNRIAVLEDLVINQKTTERFHYNCVLNYYERHIQQASNYAKELKYLHRLGKYCNFPYQPSSGLVVESGFDEKAQLPFVIHDGKKLFFPKTFSVDDSVNTYLNYIQVEKLLGDTSSEGTPHQYQSPNVHVEEGDVVFDIGAAEGLFALDQIDKASHVIIVENDPQWLEPLQYTFAPYGNKVTIIQKFISATDTENTMSLDKLLSNTDYCSAFIKMDIEGYELPSISSALKILKERKGTKISATTYHYQNDADELKSLFNAINYISEYSNGYMLFHLYDMPTTPYFRHGIIRAYNPK